MELRAVRVLLNHKRHTFMQTKNLHPLLNIFVSFSIEKGSGCHKILPVCWKLPSHLLGQVASNSDYLVFEANFMEGSAHAEPVNRLLLLSSTQRHQTWRHKKMDDTKTISVQYGINVPSVVTRVSGLSKPFTSLSVRPVSVVLASHFVLYYNKGTSSVCAECRWDEFGCFYWPGHVLRMLEVLPYCAMYLRGAHKTGQNSVLLFVP